MDTGLNGVMNAIANQYVGQNNFTMKSLRQEFPNAFNKTTIPKKTEQKDAKQTNDAGTEVKEETPKGVTSPEDEARIKRGFAIKESMSLNRLSERYDKFAKSIDAMMEKGLTGEEKVTELDLDALKEDESMDRGFISFLKEVRYAVEYTQKDAKPISNVDFYLKDKEGNLMPGSYLENFYNHKNKMNAMAEQLGDKSISELAASYLNEVSGALGGQTSVNAEKLGVTGAEGFSDLKTEVASASEALKKIAADKLNVVSQNGGVDFTA